MIQTTIAHTSLIDGGPIQWKSQDDKTKIQTLY
jgi:hypothetical protein